VSKRCACGLDYSAEEFRGLRLVGYGSDAPHGRLEYRQCACRSTLVVRVVSPPRRASGSVRGPDPRLLVACAIAGVPYGPELRVADVLARIRARFAA
jgi:hypothetical protein